MTDIIEEMNHRIIGLENTVKQLKENGRAYKSILKAHGLPGLPPPSPKASGDDGKLCLATGKVIHANHHIAAVMMTRVCSNPTEEGLNVFHCAFCGGFHFGHHR